MILHQLTPVLNVSDFAASVRWFEALGFSKTFDWGEPPTFGGVKAAGARSFFAKADREAKVAVR